MLWAQWASDAAALGPRRVAGRLRKPAVRSQCDHWLARCRLSHRMMPRLDLAQARIGCATPTDTGPRAEILGTALKSVRAPVLTADPVVDEEVPLRVIAVLDRLEARIMRPPKSFPPVAAKEIRLGHIRTRTGRDLLELGSSP